MRVVFMGTPQFAVPSLKALIQEGHQVCGVFCQPDQPVGRHQRTLQAPPVKVCAQEHHIPVEQPTCLGEEEVMQKLRQMDPQIIVVAAYGRLLPQQVLELPPKGCINVHSSLLPRYRGAAPIHWAILQGEKETGVTIMEMSQDLDAGDLLAQASLEIGPTETAEELQDRLASLGGKLLCETLHQIQEGGIRPVPQNPQEVTWAPKLSRSLSPIQWTKRGGEIDCQVRGLLPWPVASTHLGQDQVKVFAGYVTGESTEAPPGALLSGGSQGIDVACGDGTVFRITELQAPGGKRMSAGAYLRGHPGLMETDKAGWER